MTSKEFFGSAGIAVGVTLGTLALGGMKEDAPQMHAESVSASDLRHAADIAAESGDTATADADRRMAASDAKDVAKTGGNHDADAFVALTVLAAGMGLLGSQAYDDARGRQAISSPSEPVPHLPHEATQRIGSITVPVPRTEPPVLQKR